MAQAMAISYFSEPVLLGELDRVPAKAFLGQAVVINYQNTTGAVADISYVFEAVLSAPALPSSDGDPSQILNNFIYTKGNFNCAVGHRLFSIAGVYYCQQNSKTHVCAHASLRMALATLSKQSTQISAETINHILNLQPPFVGLTIPQMTDVVEKLGFAPEVINCRNIAPSDYRSTLVSIIESGDLALLGFTTGHQAGVPPAPIAHVVTVFGHTRNSDAWHPQAVPAYAGPNSAKYYTSSSWVDHFLIHDDNFGPYYTLSASALETNKNVAPSYIIAIRKSKTFITVNTAETIAASVLANYVPYIKTYGHGRWFDYVVATAQPYVLRTILVSRDEYLAHLSNAVAHDLTNIDASEFALIGKLPDQFWMVEFTLPPLYTGNRSKLGEIILEANQPRGNTAGLVIGLRLPSLWVMKNQAGKFDASQSAMTSHCPVFTKADHNVVW